MSPVGSAGTPSTAAGSAGGVGASVSSVGSAGTPSTAAGSVRRRRRPGLIGGRHQTRLIGDRRLDRLVGGDVGLLGGDVDRSGGRGLGVAGVSGVTGAEAAPFDAGGSMGAAASSVAARSSVAGGSGVSGRGASSTRVVAGASAPSSAPVASTPISFSIVMRQHQLLGAMKLPPCARNPTGHRHATRSSRPYGHSRVDAQALHSARFAPVAVSTTSGTSSSTMPSITDRTRSLVSSIRSSGTSKTSSSWIWSSIDAP